MGAWYIFDPRIVKIPLKKQIINAVQQQGWEFDFMTMSGLELLELRLAYQNAGIDTHPIDNEITLRNSIDADPLCTTILELLLTTVPFSTNAPQKVLTGWPPVYDRTSPFDYQLFTPQQVFFSSPNQIIEAAQDVWANMVLCNGAITRGIALYGSDDSESVNFSPYRINVAAAQHLQLPPSF